MAVRGEINNLFATSAMVSR